MKTILFKSSFFAFLLLAFSACEVDTVDEDRQIPGLKPVYYSGDDWFEVRVEEPHSLRNLGKIYYYNKHIFVSELLQGVHIINNNDPNNPVPLKFLKIIGAKDMAVKGDFLYVDNLTDMVVLDIRDLENIKVVNRVENIYPQEELGSPEGYSGYFECVDATKGVVVDWEEATLTDPKCFK